MANKNYAYMYGQAYVGLSGCLEDFQAIQRCLAAKNYHGVETFLALGILAASRPIKLNIDNETEVEEILPYGKAV